VARELGNAKLEARAELTVKILDANDHSPQFAREAYKAEIMEDASPGQVILKVINGNYIR